VIFIAAYLALSLPAVIAGLASQHYGLRDTALVYIAVIAALAAAAMTSLRRPRPDPSKPSASRPVHTATNERDAVITSATPAGRNSLSQELVIYSPAHKNPGGPRPLSGRAGRGSPAVAAP